jgi:hypothetical protein
MVPVEKKQGRDEGVGPAAAANGGACAPSENCKAYLLDGTDCKWCKFKRLLSRSASTT